MDHVIFYSLNICVSKIFTQSVDVNIVQIALNVFLTTVDDLIYQTMLKL